MDKIYKILTKSEYNKFKEEKVFHGSELDLKDGYIHLSFEQQTKRTLEKFFAGQSDLYILSFSQDLPHLKIESLKGPGSEEFPHLYGSLRWNDVLEVSKI